MTKTFDDLFGGKFLKADDLPEEDLPVTIKDYELTSVGQDKQEKLLITFKELDKQLVLNKTNAGTIAELYGKDFEEWPGKRVALFTTEVDFQGKSVLAVRIRKRAPGKPAPAAPPAEPEY